MDRFQRSIYGKVTPINLFKIRASYGLSGWDGNLSHELWRQSYGSGGAGYNFGVNAGGQSGGSEGDLPVIGLVAENHRKRLSDLISLLLIIV